MDKKAVFYHAVLTPQVRKQSVWLGNFPNRSGYTYNKTFGAFLVKKNHFKFQIDARIISESLWYRQLLFAPK